jgi:hypothetical protein
MSNQAAKDNKVIPYLLLREAKIARNKDKLERLGLNNPSTTKSSSDSSATRTSRSRSAAHEKSSRSLVATTRSSQRVSNGTPVTKSEVQNLPVSTIGVKEFKSKKRQRSEESNSSKPKAVVRSEAKPGTTRATYVDAKKVLCGHFDYPLFIGRRLANTGKAAVVEHANFMCGNEVGISFNKYSGVCEFQNDVLFLWVNMNTPDADIKNKFVVDNDKAQMTWYGGSRMREESPVIQKLISIGQGAKTGKNPDSCGIILFYRMYNLAKRVFEPYTCLGRLSYDSHEIGSQPIRFVWNLLDFDILKQATEPGGSCIINEIMERNL